MRERAGAALMTSPSSPVAEAAQRTDDLTCPATADGGSMKCVKPMYRARNGEVWEHGGGHFFATPAAAEKLATGDFDARVVLSSLRPCPADSAEQPPTENEHDGGAS